MKSKLKAKILFAFDAKTISKKKIALNLGQSKKKKNTFAHRKNTKKKLNLLKLGEKKPKNPHFD